MMFAAESRVAHRWCCAIIALGLAALLLGCGGPDGFATPAAGPKGEPTAEDAARAAEVIADPNFVFAGDEEAADCFATEVIDSIGEDRLLELGVDRESVALLLVNSSEDFVFDWDGEEIDLVLADLQRCVDSAEATRGLVAGRVGDGLGWTNSETDCVVDNLPNNYAIQSLRGDLYALIGENKMDEVSKLWIDALETCGLMETG